MFSARSALTGPPCGGRPVPSGWSLATNPSEAHERGFFASSGPFTGLEPAVTEPSGFVGKAQPEGRGQEGAAAGTDYIL